MKGKLNKQGDRWVLYNEDSSKIALSTESPFYKLSLKNCEAIENGYDLDEMANSKWDALSKDLHFNNQDKVMWCGGFKHGLLEILGYKKFSEEDMRKALSAGLSIGYGRQFEIENKQIEIDKYIQSLQQTEWDVEIEMVSIPADRAPNGWDISPKLDEDGCLILKRI